MNNQSEGYQCWWLTCGYDLDIGTFLEVLSMVVICWLVVQCSVTSPSPMTFPVLALYLFWTLIARKTHIPKPTNRD